MRNTSHWNPKDALPPGVVRHRHQVTSKDGDTRLDAAPPALDKATSALVLVSRLRLPGRCLGYAGLSALLAACSPSPHLYVAPEGADANSGTKASPFLTIARADAAAAPGYTIHVAPGAYPVSAPTLHSAGIVTSRSGTAAARIRFVSDIKWAAKILVSGTGIAWRSKGNYVDIDGFDISGSGRHGILADGANLRITSNLVHDLTISGGCTGSGGAAIDTNGGPGNVLIEGNVIRNIGAAMIGKCNTVQGIYSANPDNTVVNNFVSGVAAAGIQSGTAQPPRPSSTTRFFDARSGFSSGVAMPAPCPRARRTTWFQTISSTIILPTVSSKAARSARITAMSTTWSMPAALPCG